MQAFGLPLPTPDLGAVANAVQSNSSDLYETVLALLQPLNSQLMSNEQDLGACAKKLTGALKGGIRSCRNCLSDIAAAAASALAAQCESAQLAVSQAAYDIGQTQAPPVADTGPTPETPSSWEGTGIVASGPLPPPASLLVPPGRPDVFPPPAATVTSPSVSVPSSRQDLNASSPAPITSVPEAPTPPEPVTGESQMAGQGEEVSIPTVEAAGPDDTLTPQELAEFPDNPPGGEEGDFPVPAELFQLDLVEVFDIG